ncbi:23178_t:CDS:2 [Entrophospora sp. SA101]|nr:23178_t:CDS:2 [Entrophospora sp. SA101]CAJ0845072.1 8000_t:CDS:2 [Entrophospora sp. SA101]CAJ0918284.1 21728_t:CDS:2 [Entrophospora sp. SA101]
MVSNQTEFNNNYSKKAKEIKIKRKDFQGKLIIENYSELEKLYLYDIRKTDEIVLKNLSQLQLNLRSNNLTNLNFLKYLPNLEELELDGNTETESGLENLPETLKIFSYENTKLSEILKPHKGVLNFLIKEEELKSKEIDLLITSDLLENIKNLKEDLSKTQKTKKELEEKLTLYETVRDKIQQKERELEELTNNIISNNPEIKDDLEELLEAQQENNKK